MKSLEHIIREIRQGKVEKGNKKSLEGAIRNVMKGEKESSFADRTTKPITDDVGGLIGSGTGGEPKLHKEAVGVIGTDDYQGNQFKSVRTTTPHIKPPAGPDGHSQAPENVSRQRTLAKEKGSMTLHGKVNEEYLNELEKKKTGDETLDRDFDFRKQLNDPTDFDPAGLAGLKGLPGFEYIGGAGKGSVSIRSVGRTQTQTRSGQPARKAPEKAPERGPGPYKTPANDPGTPKTKPTPAPTEPIVPKPTIPDRTPPIKVPARKVPKPANVPEPAKPAAPETPKPAGPAPKVEPPKPAPAVPTPDTPKAPSESPKPWKEVGPEAPATKPVELPAIDIPGTKTQPKTKPDTKVIPDINIPAAKPQTKTEPRVVPLPAIDVGTRTKTATDTTVAPATVAVPAAVEAPATATTPKSAETTTTPKDEKEKPKFPGLGALGVPHAIDYTASFLHRPKVSAGHAKPHKRHAMREESERKEIENMPRKGDRRSIEYVGRKDSDSKSTREKTSRLATIKNVIDEARKAMKSRTEDGKTKVYDYGDDVVIINPNQKRVDLDVEGNKVPNDYK